MWEYNNRVNKCDAIKIQISEIMGLVGKVKSSGESAVMLWWLHTTPYDTGLPHF